MENDNVNVNTVPKSNSQVLPEIQANITPEPISKNSSFLGPMVDNIINSFLEELKKKKYKDKIKENIIDPILGDIIAEYYSYFLALAIALVLIIILLVLLLVVNTSNYFKLKSLLENKL